MKMGSILVWLDEATFALVKETVNLLIEWHADILLAVILFGSVARHEERPPDDDSPSDVDLLAIFDTADLVIPGHIGKTSLRPS
jgi:predicted nucleotidyltransferase